MNLPRWARAAGGLLVMTSSMAGCSSAPSRAEVVAGVTQELVPQQFEELARDSATVVDGVQLWCEGGGADTAVRAIDSSRVAWAGVDAFMFGPVSERRSRFIVDPRIREDDVDALGTDGHAVDAASLRELAGADQRGWGAVEHLVAGEPTDRRCAYATGAAQLVVDELQAVAAAWDADGAALAGDDAAANMALRDIVSESVFALRMSIDAPDPTLDAARLDGVRLAMLGDGTTTGISPLLSGALVERLRGEIDRGDTKAVEITISTEVVGELGLSVNFSDADGDG